MSNPTERELALLAQIEKLKAEVVRLKEKLKTPGAALAAKRKTYGGPARLAERCPCGQNSLKRATARGFDCCKKAGISVQPQAR